MEDSSALPSGSHNQNPPSAGAGAAKFLADLPSRGLFSSTVFSSNPGYLGCLILGPCNEACQRTGHLCMRCIFSGGMRVYLCDHDTSPPADQLIKTNQTNILIRSLMLKKQKGDSSSKEGKANAANESSRKRTADRASESRAKRAMTSIQAASRQEGSRSRLPEKDLQSLTVERIRALLKERGLSLKGRKDELIARLKDANE